MAFPLERPTATPWEHAGDYWPALDRATAELDPPFGMISLAALAHNAHSMLDRANGTTIRVASKSVRVRQVLDAVLALPGYSGVLAYTLPEALWLAGQESAHAPYTRRELKKRTYGTERPNLYHETEIAVREARRHAKDTRRLEHDFPGFAALAKDVRDWREIS